MTKEVLAHITININKVYHPHRQLAFFSTSSPSTLRSSKPSSKLQQYIFIFLKGRQPEHVGEEEIKLSEV